MKRSLTILSAAVLSASLLAPASAQDLLDPIDVPSPTAAPVTSDDSLTLVTTTPDAAPSTPATTPTSPSTPTTSYSDLPTSDPWSFTDESVPTSDPAPWDPPTTEPQVPQGSAEDLSSELHRVWDGSLSSQLTGDKNMSLSERAAFSALGGTYLGSVGPFMLSSYGSDHALQLFPVLVIIGIAAAVISHIVNVVIPAFFPPAPAPAPAPQPQPNPQPNPHPNPQPNPEPRPAPAPQHAANANNGGGNESARRVPPAGSYFRYCRDIKEAGYGPVYVGEPGYRPALDRDKDGIACE